MSSNIQRIQRLKLTAINKMLRGTNVNKENILNKLREDLKLIAGLHARDATKDAERWAAVNEAPPVPGG